MALNKIKKDKKIIVGILQFAPLLGQVEENLAQIKKYLCRRKFDIAILPELATTGYNFADRKSLKTVSEKLGGPTTKFFEQLSIRTGGAIIWGFAESCRGRIYNSAVMTTPNGDNHLYRKTHLFFREKEIFDKGNTGFNVFKWRGYRIGMMICFDWIFPEAARTLALKKCQLICHPANLVMSYCQASMITRSVENGIFCATANRVGTEGDGANRLEFTGKSQIIEPKGRRIMNFSPIEQGFNTVKLNPKEADIKNINKYNGLLKDRRVGFYKLRQR